MTYNPRVDITAETTTLYASDRDVFAFLVDDLNPIEAGRLPDGSPDLYFRGFYAWNSEVAAAGSGSQASSCARSVRTGRFGVWSSSRNSRSATPNTRPRASPPRPRRRWRASRRRPMDRPWA